MNLSLLNFSTADIVCTSVFGGLFLAFVIYLCFVPMKCYFTALFSGTYISTFRLLSIKNRKLNPLDIVSAYIMAKKGKINVTLNQIESAVLSGGNITEILKAMKLAQDSKNSISFELASAIDLASHNVVEAVQSSISSMVVPVENIRAFSQNGVEIIARVKASVKLDLERYIGGLGLDDLRSTINSWIVENISHAKDYKDILKDPNKTLIGNIDLRVLSQKSMYKVLDISVASVETGRDLNHEREIKIAEKEKAYAQIEAERMKHAEEIKELKMRTRTEEMKASVLQAESEVPLALSQAIKEGRFSIMDYYKLMNLQADTALRKSILSDKPDADNFDGEGDMFE